MRGDLDLARLVRLLEMRNCYCKHIEANGGSQNHGGQGKPHVDHSVWDVIRWLVASAGGDFDSAKMASALVR